MPKDDDYEVQVSRVVRQQLLELPPGERDDVLNCLRRELTGDYGDQTSKLEAWALEEEYYWTTILSCGDLAVYRDMSSNERSQAAIREAHLRAFMVLYLILDLDPGGAH